MTLDERLIFMPLGIVLYGWSGLLVCALFALDTSSITYRVFVGPYYLLTCLWALALLLLVVIAWQRPLRLVFKRAARHRRNLTRHQQIAAYLCLGLLTLLLLAALTSSSILFSLVFFIVLGFISLELFEEFRKRWKA